MRYLLVIALLGFVSVAHSEETPSALQAFRSCLKAGSIAALKGRVPPNQVRDFLSERCVGEELNMWSDVYTKAIEAPEVVNSMPNSADAPRVTADKAVDAAYRNHMADHLRAWWKLSRH